VLEQSSGDRSGALVRSPIVNISEESAADAADSPPAFTMPWNRCSLWPEYALELLDDRVGVRASILTSQRPTEHWHEYLSDPTLADAIMDRLVHCSHQIHLKGKESMRKRTANAGKDVAKD